MGSIYVELLSSHGTSQGSMLLYVRLSHWIHFGFPSLKELANFDTASACQFSDCSMCAIEKCLSSLVASRTRRMWAAILSSFTSYPS